MSNKKDISLSGSSKNFFDVVCDGKYEDVEKYLEKYGDRFIHERDPGWFGATGALYAARFGFPTILRLLIDHGADINVENKFGDTALHYSSYWNHLECVKILVNSGAIKNRGNKKKGRTALHWASANGSMDIAQYLISNGSDPNFKDFNGETPLDLSKIEEMKNLLSEKSIIRTSFLAGDVTILCKNEEKLSVSRIHLDRSPFLKTVTSQSQIINIKAYEKKIIEVVLQWFGGSDGNMRPDKLSKQEVIKILELSKKWEIKDLQNYCFYNVFMNMLNEVEIMELYEQKPNNKLLEKYIQEHYVRILRKSENYLSKKANLLFKMANIPSKVLEIQILGAKQNFQKYVVKELYKNKEKNGNLVLISRTGKRFKIHIEIVRIISPLITELLSNNENQKNKENEIELRMEGFSDLELHVIVEYIYKRKVKTKDINVLFRLMKLHVTREAETDFLRKIIDSVDKKNFFEVIKNMKNYQLKGIWLETHKDLLKKLISKFSSLDPKETIYFMLE